MLAVRPEEMTILPAASPPPPGACAIHGVLDGISFSGPTAICRVAVEGRQVSVLLKNSELDTIPASGPVTVCWPAARSMPILEGTEP